MGVDPALNNTYPSVFIDDEQFFYGREPDFGQYLVSHPYEGKRYWCFETEEAMTEFLDNLPESAHPPTINGLALWNYHGLMPQRDYSRIFAEHRRYLRTLLEFRRAHGLTYRYRDDQVG